MDIQGVVKSTIVRGEDDFPQGVLRVTDCHDMAAYALAPLQYASILGCSNCTLVVGAVGRLLRIEGCTRITVIAASVRVCISSCHECTFHLGVNRPPLLIGLNRFIQVQPDFMTVPSQANQLPACLDSDFHASLTMGLRTGQRCCRLCCVSGADDAG